jgi:hypothetical protein
MAGTGDAYRPVPGEGELAGPKLWRPWMTRLAVLLACLLMPGLTTAVTACSGPWSDAHVPALPLLLCSHCLVSATVAGVLSSTGDLTARRAVTIACGAVVLPALLIIRLAKWVARGE